MRVLSFIIVYFANPCLLFYVSSLCRIKLMVAGVFVFADHMSPRPARFNSRFNLLDQSSFLSWPIWSVNAIPESLFWCSGSQNFSQYLMALHFVFVCIGKQSTSDLHAFELQNLLTPNSHLMNFVWTNSIGSFSSFPSWSTPQTSLPYVSIGEITRKIVNIFSITILK